MAFSKKLGEAYVETRVDLGGAREDLGKLRKEVDNSTERMGRSFDGLGRRAKAAFAAIATAATLRALDGAISRLDAIGKTADRLGLTTRALQELRSAAEQSGVAAQTFDMAFQRFGRRVAQARQGFGEAKKALDLYNIALVDSNGKARGLEDILNDVADVMSKMENQTDRNALAFSLFDSEGVALVNTLGGGADALDKMRERAQEMNAVVGDDSIRAAEALRTEIDLLTNAVGNLFVQAVGRAAQALNRFLGLSKATAQEEIARIDQQISFIEKSPLPIFGGEEAKRKRQQAIINLQAERAIQESRIKPPEIPDIPVVEPFVSPGSGGGTGGGGARRSGGGAAARTPTDEEARRLIENVRGMIDALQKEREEVGLTDEQLARLRIQRQREATVAELANLQAKEGVIVREEQRLQIMQLADEHLILAQNLQREREAYEDLEQRREKAKQQQEELTQGLIDLGGEIANEITNADNLGQAFGRLAIRMADLIFIQGAIANRGPFASLFNGGGAILGGLFGGIAGGGSGASTALTGFANGTRSRGRIGGLSLVGERGAELAALPSGSQVLTHAETMEALNNDGGGGGAAVFNINISADGAVEGTARMIAKEVAGLRKEIPDLLRASQQRQRI